MKPTYILLLIALLSCKTNKPMPESANDKKEIFIPQYVPGPHILVYKTKADYEKLVPVILSEDKKTIVSYPSPSDLKKGEAYQTPTILHKNFLLDNRGINVNVAFLKLTYEQYVAPRTSSYAIDELYGLIIDKDPLVELYDCGLRDNSKDVVGLLNGVIDEAGLAKTCKRLK